MLQKEADSGDGVVLDRALERRPPSLCVGMGAVRQGASAARARSVSGPSEARRALSFVSTGVPFVKQSMALSKSTALMAACSWSVLRSSEFAPGPHIMVPKIENSTSPSAERKLAQLAMFLATDRAKPTAHFCRCSETSSVAAFAEPAH